MARPAPVRRRSGRRRVLAELPAHAVALRSARRSGADPKGRAEQAKEPRTAGPLASERPLSPRKPRPLPSVPTNPSTLCTELHALSVAPAPEPALFHVFYDPEGTASTPVSHTPAPSPGDDKENTP